MIACLVALAALTLGVRARHRQAAEREPLSGPGAAVPAAASAAPGTPAAPLPSAVLPALASSTPAAGASAVPPAEWLVLRFAAPVAPEARAAVALRCGGAPRPVAVHPLGDRVLVVNPDGEMPAGADCALGWPGPDGPARLAFRTAPRRSGGYVFYNRANPRSTAPFPDDFWLRAQPGHPDDRRLDIEMTGFGDPDQLLVDAMRTDAQGLDGFSPVAHLTVQLSEPADPDSLPLTPAASLDPLASIGLFDLTPGSPSFGGRVPFRAEARTDTIFGRSAHSLLLFPSVALAPRGRYGLVITRRARTASGASLEPSLFFRFARDAPPVPGEPEALSRVRKLAGEVLDDVAQSATPPIPRDDVALALRFTVRSADHALDDLLAIKQDVLAAPPPVVEVDSVEPEEEGDVVAVVHGSFLAPDYRARDRTLAHDPATGRPMRTATRRLPFVLALPAAALEAPVPVVMYQHGNPGSAEAEVVPHARRYLAGAGYAVIGFTDTLNREVGEGARSETERAYAQSLDLLWRLAFLQKLPDYFIQTQAEQFAFLRAIEKIASIRRFEIGDPDSATPADAFGIDPAQPILYVGVSEGANHAPALLAVSPEIRAAALVAGGRRFSEVLIYQGAQSFVSPLAFLGFHELNPTDVWVLLALLQTIFDPQDPHTFAPFIYRHPVEVAGSLRRASILLTEGIGDSFVPNHATEALAATLGPLPQLEPVQRPVPMLEPTPGPVVANIDAHTTAAFYQFVPQGIPGLAPTPGCRAPPLSEQSAHEGHSCAQGSEEALRQRLVFFDTALSDAAPKIIDPLSE